MFSNVMFDALYNFLYKLPSEPNPYVVSFDVPVYVVATPDKSISFSATLSISALEPFATILSAFSELNATGILLIFCS